MANPFLSCRVPQEVIDHLDALAAYLGVSRSKALVECIMSTEIDDTNGAEKRRGGLGLDAEPAFRPGFAREDASLGERMVMTVYDCPGCGDELMEKPVNGRCPKCPKPKASARKPVRR